MTWTGWARGHKFRVFPRKLTEEEKKKVSLRFKGKPLSDEHKRKISEANKGKIGHSNSPENLKLLSDRWKGENNPKWQNDRESLRLRRLLKGKCHFLLKRCLKRSGKGKGGKTSEEILGYTFTELKQHIESLWKPGMTWENYGRKGWHIDHVKPFSLFAIDAHPAEINSLSNLQPLWWHENLSKGDRISKQEKAS